VPADHLLRPTDRFVELFWRQFAPNDGTVRRPSIDPELMIRIASSARSRCYLHIPNVFWTTYDYRPVCARDKFHLAAIGQNL
jgi:hypothetical protein